MIAARHILGTFDESLAALRNNVLMMAGLTERSLERAMKGLVNRDDNICTTCNRRRRRDRPVGEADR